MKLNKIINQIIIVVLLIGYTTTFSQVSFEGKIEYKITYQKVPEILKGYEHMLPEKSIVYVKGFRSRIEVEVAASGTQIVIFDKEKNTGLILMDIADKKTAITLSKEIVEKELSKVGKPKITYFEEYKTIIGYKCQKAIIETVMEDSSTQKSTVYFTKQIKNTTQNFGDLSGMALEYNMSQNDTESRLTATSVLLQSVLDSDFEIPKGYEVTTLEAFIK